MNDDADVIVVGGGPAGSATAYYCAQAGLSVLLLDKATFPRDKICGDGLTPRATRELALMGVPIREEDGWIRNKGLRVIGGGHRIELEWPELSTYPSYGLARSRMSFDQLLVEHARAAGAKVLEGTAVTGPVIDERSGRVVGVTAKPVDAKGRRSGEDVTYRAPVVVAADGVSSRLATAVGREKRDDRPMGVAVRTYFRTPRRDDAWMESHLEPWDGEPGRSNLVPGYGWIFALRDGTARIGLATRTYLRTPRHDDAWMESHRERCDGEPGRSTLMPGYGWIFALGDGAANVGLGSVSSTAHATKVDYKVLFERWIAHAPAE